MRVRARVRVRVRMRVRGTGSYDNGGVGISVLEHGGGSGDRAEDQFARLEPVRRQVTCPSQCSCQKTTSSSEDEFILPPLYIVNFHIDTLRGSKG